MFCSSATVSDLSFCSSQKKAAIYIFEIKRKAIFME
jgi:hypothetical protein